MEDQNSSNASGILSLGGYLSDSNLGSPSSMNIWNLTDLQSDVLFYGYTVLIPVICSFGVVGNIVSLTVLLQAPLRNKTPYIYLIALAFADMVTVSLEMTNGIAQGTCAACYGWKVFDSYVHLPVGGMSSTMSVSTISVYTAERFVYIKAPFMARRYCKPLVARRATLVALLFAVLFNIPYFFAFYVDPATNQMCYTTFADGKVYEALDWVRLILLGLAPAILLAVVNLTLIVTLHRAHRMRRALLRPRHYLHEEYRLHQRYRVTACLLSMILLFTLGELPTDITSRTSAMYIMYGGDQQKLNTWQYQVIRRVSTSLMCLNYSCNFLLYCSLDTKFGQIFGRTFCRWNKSNETVVHNIAVLQPGT